ncbi:MAG: histidine phosphatase family protein [Actinomycetota bacterium]|nr:histidine phosphatase family protein [Actinomycetota bacterium]
MFCSDLRRSVETVEIAFAGSDIPVLLDWRLRECDYGAETQHPVDKHHVERCGHVDRPYPGGESWSQAVQRVERFLDDLPLRWNGGRVLLVGHVATRWALDPHQRRVADGALQCRLRMARRLGVPRRAACVSADRCPECRVRLGHSGRLIARDQRGR